MKIVTKGDVRPEDYESAYQEDLTKRLDAEDGDFDQAIINEITLWKVSRYPIIKPEILAELNEIKRTDTSFDEEKVRKLIIGLLECNGVQMPMASTYLRFKNPDLFQIIDQRVYRVIYGDILKLPGSYNPTNREKIVSIYFKYLRDLRTKCKELDIPFSQSDRILFNTDSRVNKKVTLQNY